MDAKTMPGHERSSAGLTREQISVLRNVLGRIGHDLGNMITPMMAYPPLLRMDIAPGARGHELIDAMEQSAQSILTLTRQMLSFAVCEDFECNPVDVVAIVRAAVGEQERSLPANIRVDVVAEEDEIRVSGSIDKLIEVVGRLWANAVDAMPDGGQLSVKVSRMTTAVAAPAHGGTVPAGAYTVVTVTDTGRGIDPRLLPQVFDPFFTTKRDRKKRGSGLGLTYVYAVVRAHGGWVQVSSEPGQGTTVRVMLPAPLPEGMVEAPNHA